MAKCVKWTALGSMFGFIATVVAGYSKNPEHPLGSAAIAAPFGAFLTMSIVFGSMWFAKVCSEEGRGRGLFDEMRGGFLPADDPHLGDPSFNAVL